MRDHAAQPDCLWLILAIAFCTVLPLTAGQKPPELYFGGQSLTLGMRVSDVMAVTSECCVVTPPLSVDTGDGGHFIRIKSGQTYQLGSIFFKGGRVSRISRPIDSDFDGYNDDVVRLARALQRALAPTTGDSTTTVLLSVQHTRLSNGNGEIRSPCHFPMGGELNCRYSRLILPRKLPANVMLLRWMKFLNRPDKLPRASGRA